MDSVHDPFFRWMIHHCELPKAQARSSCNVNTTTLLLLLEEKLTKQKPAEHIIVSMNLHKVIPTWLLLSLQSLQQHYHEGMHQPENAGTISVNY